MLNISPHPPNLLAKIHEREHREITNKSNQTISPSGPRAHCLDLANCKTVTPQLLLALTKKLNKLGKQKNDLNIEAYSLRKSIRNVREIINKVKIICFNFFNF